MPDVYKEELQETTTVTTATPTSSNPPIQPPQRRNGGLLAAILTVSILSAVLSGITLWTVWDKPESEPEMPPVVTEPNVLQEGIDFIRYRERQLPIFENVLRNTYDMQAFGIEDNNWKNYITSDLTAIHGVDVSEYQGVIDWQTVANSGIEFAMIRVGYRGYGESGIIKEDLYFHQNIQGALAAGLDVGVYFFSQATTSEEAIEEAQFVLNSIDGYDITYPVTFDWEFISGRTARTDGISGKTITLMANHFGDTITAAGYNPAIYFNMDMGYLHLELEDLTDYPFWLAAYRATPDFFYHYDLWQYTDIGKVDGIEGDVDLNLAFRDLSEN